MSRVLVTAKGFGLVIGFINYSQVVTTINYNTVPDFYTTKHSTLIISVYLHLSSLSVSWQRISIQELSQSHTSNVTHKVFNSHDPLFSNYEPSTVVSHLELTNHYSRTSFSLSYKPLIWHVGKRFNCCVTAVAVMWPLCATCHGSVRHGENTASSTVA
jgi:hypothetical protein